MPDSWQGPQPPPVRLILFHLGRGGLPLPSDRLRRSATFPMKGKESAYLDQRFSPPPSRGRWILRSPQGVGGDGGGNRLRRSATFPMKGKESAYLDQRFSPPPSRGRWILRSPQGVGGDGGGKRPPGRPRVARRPTSARPSERYPPGPRATLLPHAGQGCTITHLIWTEPSVCGYPATFQSQSLRS